MRRLMFILACFGLALPASAEVPLELHYNGYLTNAVGEAVDCPDAIQCTTPFDMTFRIYASSEGGEALWEELYPGMSIFGGSFHAILGSITPVDAELLDGSVWLAIKVNEHPEMLPRQKVASSAYAIRAGSAEEAAESANASQLGGVDASEYATQAILAPVATQGLSEDLADGDDDVLGGMTCADGMVAKASGPGTWVCGVDDTGNEDTTLSEEQVDLMISNNGFAFQEDLETAQASLAELQALLNTLEADTEADLAALQAQVTALETSLSSLEESLTNETNARTAKDSELETALGVETSARTAEDAVLGTAIGDETTARSDGDLLLQGNINVVQANLDALDGSLGPIAKASLDCTSGQVSQWNGSAWVCGSGGQWTDEGGYLAASNAPSVAVTDTGNLGIGTTSPAAQLEVAGTGAIIVPIGTTTQRPASPTTGMIRFNSDLAVFEGYDGSGWKALSAITSTVVTAGLELHMDAGNSASYAGSGGTWYDMSGGAHNATKWGSVNYSSEAGGAFSFDGGGFDVTPWSNYHNAPEITLEIWAKLRSHASINTGMITNFAGGAGKMNWMWSSTGGGRGIHNNGMKGATNSSAGLYDFNKWYRFALRYRSGVGYEFYVNNNIVHTQGASGHLGGAVGSIGIGSREDHVEPSDSLIAVARIYTRALTDSELENNFNAEKGRFGY